MAWTYGDWVTYAPGASRLARLRLHVQEVSDQVVREVSADGKSVSSSAVQAYLNGLMDRMDSEERRAASNGAVAGGVSVADFGRRTTVGQEGAES